MSQITSNFLEKESYVCHTCKKSYYSKSGLRYHIKHKKCEEYRLQQLSNSKAPETHYIYLLRRAREKDSNLPIYKIGKTIQKGCERIKDYDKGSEGIMSIKVKDCHLMEKELLEIFDNLFENRKDIGREYYKGDVKKMRNIIHAYADETYTKSQYDKDKGDRETVLLMQNLSKFEELSLEDIIMEDK
jgi:hypothetical protein